MKSSPISTPVPDESKSLENTASHNDSKFSENAIIQIWEKAIDTQMHFNEMSAKSRQLGLAFVAAALGVAVVLMANTKDYFLSIPIPFTKCTFHAHVSGIIIIAAAAAIQAVRTLDVKVYHKMLRGAVSFGEDFENKHIKPKLTMNKGMTQAISHFSRFSDAKININDGSYTYEGKKGKSAEDKVKRFYMLTTFFLLAAASIILYSANANHLIALKAQPNTSTRDLTGVMPSSAPISNPSTESGVSDNQSANKTLTEQ